MKTRRFSRVRFEEQCLLEYGSRSLEGRLLNISLKGALVEFRDKGIFFPGDRWRLAFHLGNPDFVMRFGAEVVHTASRLAGFKFVEADLNTMFHLRNLLEARLPDPDRLRGELDCLNAEDFFPPEGQSGRAGFPESEAQSAS